MGPMNSVLATTCSSISPCVTFPRSANQCRCFRAAQRNPARGHLLDASIPALWVGMCGDFSANCRSGICGFGPGAVDWVTAAPAGTKYSRVGGAIRQGPVTTSCTRFLVVVTVAMQTMTVWPTGAPPSVFQGTIEIMEQAFPVLYCKYALREGSGGAGEKRGGFGLEYRSCGGARPGPASSWIMAVSVPRALGGAEGAPNQVTV